MIERLGNVEAELESQASIIEELTRQVEILNEQRKIQSFPNNLGSGSSNLNANANGNGKDNIDKRTGASGNNNTIAIKDIVRAESVTARSNENISEHKSSLSAALPPSDLLHELIDLYFNRIHTSYPILHPVKTNALLHDIINRSSLPPTTENEYPLVFYSIVAVTLRFIPEFRLKDDERAKYYRTCKETVMLRSFAITDLDCLQALVILAIDLVGKSNGPETWSIIPLICSASIHLGLTREHQFLSTTSDSPMSAASTSPTSTSNIPTNNESISAQSADILPQADTWMEQESRRRLFWVIYSLDRFSSVATAFSFKLNTLEIDRLLPVKEEFWVNEPKNRQQPILTRWLKTPIRKDYSIDYPENIDAFGYMMEVLQILSSIHEFLKKPISIWSLQDVLDWQVKFRHLDVDLDNWYKRLPAQISADIMNPSSRQNKLDPMMVMLHSTYQTTVIRLNSAAGFSSLKSEFFSNSPSAARRCLIAVASVVALAKRVIVFGTWQYLGPHYAWTLWVSARLLVVDCVTNHNPFPEDLEILLTGLKKLGRVWQVAARYYGLLTMVIDEELSLKSIGKGSKENAENGGITDNGDSANSGDGDDDGIDGSGRRNFSSAQILSDMRRNAYALDFLLSNKKGPASSSAERDGNNKVYEQNAAPAIQGESNISSLELSDLIEGSDIFDWFNWPKQSAQMGEKSSAQHSVDEYKNILSRDEKQFDDSAKPDWMSI